MFKRTLAVAATIAAAAMAQPADAGTCTGNCGTLGPNGVVTAPPGATTYSYVSTYLGVDGAGQLPGIGGTNGTTYLTPVFAANAGDLLDFNFDYVTSDGAGYNDYAWAALLDASLNPVAILFTARTEPSGPIVPGVGLPAANAALTPDPVTIIPGAPLWDPLGPQWSGTCYDVGCGYTGWVNSKYTVPTSGNYVLSFGVSNWLDTVWDSGMAFSGITIGGKPVDDVPEPATWAMMLLGFGAVGAGLRKARATTAMRVASAK